MKQLFYKDVSRKTHRTRKNDTKIYFEESRNERKIEYKTNELNIFVLSSIMRD